MNYLESGRVQNMTKQRILKLAYHGALQVWSFENEKLQEHPSNELTILREQRAWKELAEISDMLIELEQSK